MQIAVFAQVVDSSNTINNQYIIKHDGFLFTRLSFNNNTENFLVNTAQDDYFIKPNTSYKLKLNVSYQFISFAVALSPGFIPGNNDDLKKGKTKIYSFGLTFYIKNWFQNISFNYTKGFYLENTSDFIANWNKSTDDYIQFPELQYLGFYGYTAYKLNRNFSLKAISDQTEHQIKSAGSFIPLLSYKYYIMDNRIELTGDNSSQKSNNFETNLQLGYFYTQVISKKFYLSTGIAAGGGFIFTHLLTRYHEDKYYDNSTNPIFRLEGQLGLGYHSEHFFFGGQFLITWEKYPQQGTSATVVNDAFMFQVFVGYRFKAPGFVESSVDKIPMPGK